MVRLIVLAGAIAVSLLAVSGAGGSDTQTPKRGGTVVFGPVTEPRCLNPLVFTCWDGIVTFHWLTQKVISPAFVVAPDATARPRLIARASFTRRPPFTLTYEIRPQARWSDGVPVSAQDFVFTDRAFRRHGRPEDPHRFVRSVTAVDAKTVRVVLRSRFADWRELFQWVLPRHALAGEDLERVWTDQIQNPKTAQSIGSGPFLLKEWNRGEQLTLVRNPRYWGPHTAHIDRLVVRFCQDNCTGAEVLETLRRRDADGGLSRDLAIAPELRRLPETSVDLLGFPAWEHLALRVEAGGHPALGRKLVRRAIAYGLDRVAIAREPFGGLDPRWGPSQSAAYLNSSRYYEPNWSRYTYRPALARSLLERAGCRRGSDGIYSCGARRLTLVFYTSAANRLRGRVLELMQTQLRRAGIEVQQQFTASGAFVQILRGGEFDGFLFNWQDEPIAQKDIFGCGGEINYMGYCQRLVTEDLDQADRILDARQQARALNRVDRQLAKDVPVIPLYQPPVVFAFRRDVRNVVRTSRNPFWNAENWWLER